jgi:hypothetical protein
MEGKADAVPIYSLVLSRIKGIEDAIKDYMKNAELFLRINRIPTNANIAPNLSSRDRLFIQKYSSHPFLDVYGVKCNKGLAFDSVLSHLEEKKERGTNIIYFRDSANDNPAFRKSDISIGIRSDTRLGPLLDCKCMLDFKQLPMFLRGLMDNNYIFSEELLPHVD